MTIFAIYQTSLERLLCPVDSSMIITTSSKHKTFNPQSYIKVVVSSLGHLTINQYIVKIYFIFTVNMDTFSILLISTIILLVAWVRAKLNSQSTEDLPPGSMGLPLIGETVEFVKKKVCEVHILYNRKDCQTMYFIMICLVLVRTHLILFYIEY